MSLIVQKYGGTSVGSIERIKNVAKKIKKAVDEGHKVVVVSSAMTGETDRLLSLTRSFQIDLTQENRIWSSPQESK